MRANQQLATLDPEASGSHLNAPDSPIARNELNLGLNDSPATPVAANTSLCVPWSTGPSRLDGSRAPDRRVAATTQLLFCPPGSHFGTGGLVTAVVRLSPASRGPARPVCHDSRESPRTRECIQEKKGSFLRACVAFLADFFRFRRPGFLAMTFLRALRPCRCTEPSAVSTGCLTVRGRISLSERPNIRRA